MCLKCIKSPHNNDIKILCSDPSAAGGTGLLMSPATLQRVRAKKEKEKKKGASPLSGPYPQDIVTLWISAYLKT